jgi:2-polyprenyl-6-methoxyphenol hydroxylase-like FAD-dependent oxidoreductase
VREHLSVQDVVIEGRRGHRRPGDGGAGRRVVERARIVIAADGRKSHVFRAVGAEQYVDKPRLQVGRYT